MKNKPADSAGIDVTLPDEAKSKSMIRVGKKARPFLDYLLYNIEQAGYKDVIIVVGGNDPSIQKYYEKNGRQFKELRLSYAVQNIPAERTKPLGTAEALSIALNSMPAWRSHTFTVCNSDNLYSINALSLLLEDNHANAMIDYDRAALQFDTARIEAYSVIRKNNEGYLLDITEKPSRREIDRAKDRNGRIGVSMNIFKFSYEMILPILKIVPLHEFRQEKELPAAVKIFNCEHPESLYVIPLAEHVIDLTSQSDIIDVREYLEKEFPNF